MATTHTKKATRLGPPSHGRAIFHACHCYFAVISVVLFIQNQVMTTGELIPKEDIPKYKLARAAEDHVAELRQKLRGALRLGNEFKAKATITFQTVEGPKRVETTVWTL